MITKRTNNNRNYNNNKDDDDDDNSTGKYSSSFFQLKIYITANRPHDLTFFATNDTTIPGEAKQKI